MIVRNTPEETNTVVDQAAQSADEAIKSTKRVANEALEDLADGVEGARQLATPLLNRATEQAGALAQRGADAVRDGSRQLRDGALRVSDSTANYVKDEPIKAILIAAAVGAALMALVNLMGRSRDS